MKQFLSQETILQLAHRAGILLLLTFMGLSLAACESVYLPPDLSSPARTPERGGAGSQIQPSGVVSYAEGEVVARGQTVYRKFLRQINAGKYLVQDFYVSTDTQRTSPYVMTRPDEVVRVVFEEEEQASAQYRRLTESHAGIEGAYIQWYRNGQKAIEGMFDQGAPIGEWVLMYENGQIMLKDIWVKGVRNGPSTGWHENGQMAGQGEYLNNQREGLWTVWYPNGAKMQEGSYSNGHQEGGWVFWYDNMNQKEAGDYMNGKRVGKWIWWTHDGVLAREGVYNEMGVLEGTVAGSGRIQARHPTSP